MKNNGRSQYIDEKKLLGVGILNSIDLWFKKKIRLNPFLQEEKIQLAEFLAEEILINKFRRVRPIGFVNKGRFCITDQSILNQEDFLFLLKDESIIYVEAPLVDTIKFRGK